MNVLMISPGFPGDMPLFTRGLAEMGARVIGLGDQPQAALPDEVRPALSAHIHVPSLWDEAAVVACVRDGLAGVHVDRVECLWEPAMILAGRLREALGTPGLNVERTIPFRDKERMKQVLDAAGIRTPWHRRARTYEEIERAAADVGYPLIVKPIAGAGSADTYRVDSAAELKAVFPLIRHVTEVSVEEYIDGDELTFDTICADGQILYENVSLYRPRPIEEKKYEWVSPCSICLRDLDRPELEVGREMGRRVLDALGYRTGFSHMEWYRRPSGEVVFGEIGARSPGARLVDAMNFAGDIDLFRGWAEAVCHGRLTQPVERPYNAAVISKRARGQGRIRHVTGLRELLADYGSSVAAVEIKPIGQPRGDWTQSAVADGFLIVRHPELTRTIEMVDRIARDLHIYAG